LGDGPGARIRLVPGERYSAPPRPMTRILNLDRCPHCKVELTKPVPRMCPDCGGSLQRRYLTAGCLTSKPPLMLFALGLGWLATRLLS